MTFYDALRHIDGGQGWARPLSWRGTGRVICELWDQFVTGPSTAGIHNVSPDLFSDEKWELINHSDIEGESVMPWSEMRAGWNSHPK